MAFQASTTALENALTKLNLKRKKIIYDIARLEFRIFSTLYKLEIVETKIAEETQNLASLNQAIAAAGKGKVGEKLMAWKMKAEYKLHKLQLRKEKIDIAKLIINQSKLTQHREALITLEQGIASINMQLETAKPIEKIEKVEVTTQTADLLFTYWKKAQEPSPLSISIAQYLKDNLKIAV